MFDVWIDDYADGTMEQDGYAPSFDEAVSVALEVCAELGFGDMEEAETELRSVHRTAFMSPIAVTIRERK